MNANDMKAAFPAAINNIGKQNKKVVVVVGDIGHFAMQDFAKENEDRYYNLGILEPCLVSSCAGLSREGFYPVGHTIAPFIAERSLEQIKLDFCYQNLGGNLITVGSAFDYSTLGCTHHCYTDLGLLSSYPNTEVCYPASPNELIQLVEQRFDSSKLTYFRMARHPHGVIFDNITFGKNIVVKEGFDITLVTSGPQLKNILEVEKMLNRKNISAEIIYCHTLKPFDAQTIEKSANKTKKVFVLEEHIASGGLVSRVLETCSKLKDTIVSYHCIDDIFIRNYGTYEEIASSLGFEKNYLFRKISKLF